MSDWHLVNLLLPTLAPILILLLISLFHMSAAQRKRVSPWVAVKDGQLAWAALGMCFNALYELDHPGRTGIAPEWLITYRWALVGFVLISAITAALGPVLVTPSTRPPGWRAALWHYRVFWASVITTVVVAHLYSNVHLTTQL